MALRIAIPSLDPLDPHRSLEYKVCRHLACTELLEEVTFSRMRQLEYKTDEYR